MAVLSTTRSSSSSCRSSSRTSPTSSGLVSSEAAFICHRALPPTSTSHRCIRSLALGFFFTSTTAARWFASGSGQWGAEVRAEGARAGRMRQHTGAAMVVHRGMVVWPRLKLALLRLPKAGVRGVYRTEGSLLGSLPYGRLCWAEVSWDKTRIPVFFTHHHHYHGLADMMVSLLESPYSGQRCQRERSVVIPRSSCHCQRVKLRWFCEKSGLILFTADYRCYTLNLETMEVDMVAGFGIQGDVDNMCGYEIDRVALLSSLAHISST
ncbi:hypothetical protein OsI_25519 [Oryza sativa Indica Group]|uniref:Uncharacterized protein n=1 Tax=Oryza sativa subsp. indica TaxID=39946 RepID=B8B4R8_ORYSI|nr:hypothetical protein OsI_25519 [Oryza sativa Indica Group]